MKRFNELTFEILQENDIEILTPIMKRAFDEDTKIHLSESEGGPEGYDNGEFLKKFGLHKDSTAYKISLNDEVIGCIILWINNETLQNFLGNIFIDPKVQNKGIGQEIWKFVESEYPDTIIWRTETPGFSTRNHNFYVNKCGFHIVKIENPMNKYDSNYILEKEIRK